MFFLFKWFLPETRNSTNQESEWNTALTPQHNNAYFKEDGFNPDALQGVLGASVKVGVYWEAIFLRMCFQNGRIWAASEKPKLWNVFSLTEFAEVWGIHSLMCHSLYTVLLVLLQWD